VRYYYPDDLERNLKKIGYSKIGTERAKKELEKEGLDPKDEKLVLERRCKLIDAALLHLYEDKGLSFKAIVSLLETSYWTVQNHLRHLGAKIRPPGGANHTKENHGKNQRDPSWLSPSNKDKI
jgi:hypothetical protein